MPKIRNIIIFAVIVAVLGLIYIFFIKPYFEEKDSLASSASTTLPNIDGSTSGASAADATALTTKDFLTLFSGVKNIKLNDTIFSDTAFNSLHDSSIILTPDGTEGRPNPFAQFGNDTVLPAASTTSVNSPVSDTPISTKPKI